MAVDMALLNQWLGKTERFTERLSPFPSNALAATLDRCDPPYDVGSDLPPLWHWLHFLPISPLAQAGPDGHPARGGFLPPVPLPRRMWAGSRLTFLRPLRIGESVDKLSRVTKIEHKSGRSGELVFVTVRHEFGGAAGPAIEEEHDIVYRGAAVPGAPAPAPVPAPAHSEWRRPIHPDAVLLFRYSALTFNSHRIHYDLDYVTKVEGYPGLIVHGPLIATLLLDGLRRAHPGKRVTAFSFRAIAPTFHIDEFAVCGQLTGGRAQLWADKAGALTMDATADIA
ncbi:MAG TPA: MaoC family dehydratase N-terminal domain-containing protein [Beijerinckiaceae bacterium]|nr:MaoC family dehydratase N-terminal domain-containing protein [Beijerinckiaceae bacterium]